MCVVVDKYKDQVQEFTTYVSPCVVYFPLLQQAWLLLVRFQSNSLLPAVLIKYLRNSPSLSGES